MKKKKWVGGREKKKSKTKKTDTLHWGRGMQRWSTLQEKGRQEREGKKKKLESLNNTVSESEKLKEERKASVTEKNPQQDPC